jgi:glycosyltransferase involved in cell wall biosynthesis
MAETSPHRVLHVLDHLGAGGIQTYALNLFRHWREPGITHAIAALHGPGLNHDRFVELGLTPHYAAASKKSIGLIAGLRRIVHETQPGIVHVYGVPATLLCERFRGVLGIPRLITHLQSTYADHPGQRYQDWLEPLCYRRSDHIIACSRAVTAGLHRRAPISIIPNGIDTARFATPTLPEQRNATRVALGFEEADLVIGTSGRLVEGKDPWTLCHAFEKLVPELPQLRLLFIGGGPLHEAMNTWIASRGLARRVKITGFISPLSVPAHLHALDLFAFPSLREGSPLALAEAMTCGLPCVCADFPASREMLNPGEEGIIFPRKDDTALAAALRTLAHDLPLRQSLAAQAHSRALLDCSAETMAGRIAAVYAQVLRVR